jgi:hypothetical protein
MAKKKTSKRIQPLTGDSGREATASIAGYRYQILRSIYEWIGLGEDDCIYLEGAEDFDVVTQSSGKAFQVKHSTKLSTVTTRSSGVVSALNNYWLLRDKNKNRTIYLHFLTTSSAGVEKGSPFGRNVPGLVFWNTTSSVVSEDDRTARAKLVAATLAADALINDDLLTFLNSAKPKQVAEELIARVRWHTDEPGGAEIEAAILRQLQSLCWRKNIPTAYAARIAARLEVQAWKTATQKESRNLTVQRFYEAFDAETQVTLPHAVAAPLLMKTNDPLATALAPAIFDLRSEVAVSSHLTAMSAPPLVSNFLHRPSFEEGVEATFNQYGVVNVYGSTGTGKSNALASISQAWRNECLWIACRHFSSDALQSSLINVGRLIDIQPSIRFLILDDLDSSSHRHVLNALLPSILFTIRQRRGGLLFASYKPVGSSFRQHLGVNAKFDVPALAFTLEEIAILLERQGLANPNTRRAWSTIILASTSGHPQLVAAFIASLRQKGFSKPSEEDWLKKPDEVLDEKATARVFLGRNVSSGPRDLLYRLSLLTNPFPRDKALQVAREIPSISDLPGDAFDTLIGPWIESLGEDQYRVSPLIQGAGIESNGAQWGIDVHFQIARIWATFANQSPWDVSTILIHGALGHNGQATARIGAGLHSAPEEVWNSIGEACRVYVLFYNDPGQTFPFATSFERFFARFIQLNIALRIESSAAEKIVERVFDEFPSSLDDSQNLCRHLLLMVIMLRPSHALSLKTYGKVAVSLESFRRPELQSPEENSSVSTANAIYTEIFSSDEIAIAAPMLGFLYVQRVKTIEDLDAAIEVADTLPAALRLSHLKLFESSPDSARQLVDGVWATENQTTQPRWDRLASTLYRLCEHAERWNASGLKRGTTIVLARMLDENLRNPKKAREIIEAAVARGDESYLILDAKARLLFRQNDYAQSLEIWQSIFDNWESDALRNVIGIALSQRLAAQAAVHMIRWPEAAVFFDRAAAQSTGTHNDRFTVGLLAESTHAHWRARQFVAAVEKAVETLNKLGQIINSPEDVASHHLHKTIGHLMTWLSMRAEGRVGLVEEPAAGIFSLLDYNRDIVSLNPTPIDFSWVNLAMAASKVGVYRQDLRNRIEIVKHSQYPFARMMALRAQLEIDLLLGTMLSLVKTTLELAIAVEEVRAHDQAGLAAWESDVKERTERPNRQEIGGDLFFVYALRGLFACIGVGRSPGQLIKQLQVDANEAGGPMQFREWLVHMDDLASKSWEDWQVAIDDQSQPTYTRIAALAFQVGGVPTPEDLLRAHARLLNLEGSVVGDQVKDDVARALRTAWNRVCGNPLVLRSPRSTVPAIQSACRNDETAWVSIGRLFLAGSNALTTNVAQSIIERARIMSCG